MDHSEQRLYSVDQVADLLGLHVRTVRGYVRDGRLKAVRIGKQYRISREDLEAFAGGPVAGPPRDTAGRTRRVEVSAIVTIDAIGADGMTRLTNTLLAAVAHQDGRPGTVPVRVENVYDERRASLKVIILGDPDTVGSLLKIIDTLTRE